MRALCSVREERHRCEEREPEDVLSSEETDRIDLVIGDVVGRPPSFVDEYF